jgi:hypothetical protein
LTSSSPTEGATVRRASAAREVAVLLVTAAIMAGPGITQGGLGWSDAPNHVFDGIFIIELIKAWPIDHLRDWADQFYLRFPALGILVYYPPGFALIEAVVFTVAGVNIFTARLTVLLFAFAAAWMMVLLGRRWFDRPTGLYAALLLLTCPHGALWMNDVMLEWPATFWILLAVYCYERDRARPAARWSIAFAASIVMAFLTKQTAGFILPVILLHAAISPESKRYLRRPALLCSMGAACALIAVYLLIARRFAALPSMLLTPSVDPLFYPRHLAEIVGLPLLPLVLLGLLTLLLKPDRRARGLILLWLAAWYVFSSVITAKEPRYFFFALPPLMFAAARFFLLPVSGREPAISWFSHFPRHLLLGLILIAQVTLWFDHSTGRLPSYTGAARELMARPDADLVLVDAVRDGQFVFDLYQLDASGGKIIPLRASKMLYARAARERYGYRQFVQSPDDILRLLDRYGIRYLVIESDHPAGDYSESDPPPRQMLRDLLSQDTRFKLVGSWPLRCGDPAWDHVELRLYAYPSCPPRRDKSLTLSFPAMGRDVIITLP